MILANWAGSGYRMCTADEVAVHVGAWIVILAVVAGVVFAVRLGWGHLARRDAETDFAEARTDVGAIPPVGSTPRASAPRHARG